MPNHLKVTITVLVCWFYSGFVHSAEVELPAEILNIVGDPEYGEYLASDCKTCHKVEGLGSWCAIHHWSIEAGYNNCIACLQTEST